MRTKKLLIYSFLIFIFGHFISCNGSNKTSNQPVETKVASAQKTSQAESVSSSPENTVSDGPAIATIETSDFILKIHKAVSFTLKPKSYEPFKVDPSTKLIALDVSVRNKLSTPLNFSRILGMTVIKGKGEKNLVAPWVVAAHEVDYPEPNHQKEYDALWSNSFEPDGFHRAILFGINPSKEEKEFKLTVPEKADFNNPSRKSVQFSVE